MGTGELMDNPAYFTVLRRAGGTQSVDGLFSSRSEGITEAELARSAAGQDELFDVAIVTMLDQDPITGTPMGHPVPPRAAGFALGALSTPDPARRRLSGDVTEEWLARMTAGIARTKNRVSENDNVLDVVALTITDHDPAGATTAKEVSAP
ncbi:MAG TPA: hypothetical protein VF867_18805 [Arthrobacter sp.]